MDVIHTLVLSKLEDPRSGNFGTVRVEPSRFTWDLRVEAVRSTETIKSSDNVCSDTIVEYTLPFGTLPQRRAVNHLRLHKYFTVFGAFKTSLLITWLFRGYLLKMYRWILHDSGGGMFACFSGDFRIVGRQMCKWIWLDGYSLVRDLTMGVRQMYQCIWLDGNSLVRPGSD